MGKGNNIANVGVKRLHNDVSVCLAFTTVKDGNMEQFGNQTRTDAGSSCSVGHWFGVDNDSNCEYRQIVIVLISHEANCGEAKE